MPRASSLSRDGADVDGSIRRVPVRGRCLGSLQGVSFSRGGAGGGLGLLPRFSSCTASTEWSVVQRGSGEGRTPSSRRRSTTGTSEVRSRCRRGKKTPTPRRTGSPVHEDLRSSTIHRSVHRGVKPRSTSGPRKRRRVVPQSPTDEIPRAHEMRVFVSTVWMAEVGP